jgi:glycosyl hydrolase family 2
LFVEGRFQPDVEQEVQFAISGYGKIAAVGNGDGKDGATYQGDRRKLFQGRALVVVRTSRGRPDSSDRHGSRSKHGSYRYAGKSGSSAPRTAFTQPRT